MRTLTRTLLATLTIVAGFALMTPAASALSCAGVSDLTTREHPVFTGRIIDSEDNPGFDTGGRILVEVEEIWAQGPVKERIWLQTSLDGWWEMLPQGSFPDGFVSEKTWLFMPHPSNDGLTVNPCNSWPTTKPMGRDVRPAVVTYPVAETRPGILRDVVEPDHETPGTGLFVGVATGLVLLILGATIAWRRRNE